jgi:hypothetical protein
MLEILDGQHAGNPHLRHSLFKHKYLTNPSVTPKDQIIVAAARLINAIQGTITANMRTSTLKSLGNLQSIFHDAAKG